MAAIEANEKVFASATGDNLVSLLVWRSTAPIASIDAKARFDGIWTLRGRINAALGGNGLMTDYDWLGGSHAFDDWTDRSISPNTSLDWYVNGEVALGADVPVTDHFALNPNIGLKYTDVKWTAVGGSYIYSDPGFRDSSGTFGDVPVVDYRMQLPTAFMGLDAAYENGPWTLATSGQIGATFLAGATDNHFLRAARIEDGLDWSLNYSAEARLTYAFTKRFGAFLEADYDRTVSGHGSDDWYDATTGALTAQYPGTAGGELQVETLQAGIKGSF